MRSEIDIKHNLMAFREGLFASARNVPSLFVGKSDAEVNFRKRNLDGCIRALQLAQYGERYITELIGRIDDKQPAHEVKSYCTKKFNRESGDDTKREFWHSVISCFDGVNES